MCAKSEVIIKECKIQVINVVKQKKHHAYKLLAYPILRIMHFQQSHSNKQFREQA